MLSRDDRFKRALASYADEFRLGIAEPADLLAFLNHPNVAAATRTRDYLAVSGIARQLLAQENA